MPDANEVLESVVRYCCQNCERESIFLTPTPAFMIEMMGLMDHIASLGVLTKNRIDQISKEVANA